MADGDDFALEKSEVPLLDDADESWMMWRAAGGMVRGSDNEDDEDPAEGAEEEGAPPPVPTPAAALASATNARSLEANGTIDSVTDAWPSPPPPPPFCSCSSCSFSSLSSLSMSVLRISAWNGLILFALVSASIMCWSVSETVRRSFCP